MTSLTVALALQSCSVHSSGKSACGPTVDEMAVCLLLQLVSCAYMSAADVTACLNAGAAFFRDGLRSRPIPGRTTRAALQSPTRRRRGHGATPIAVLCIYCDKKIVLI